MRLRIGIAIVLVTGIVSCSGATGARHFDLVEFAVDGPTEIDGAVPSTTVTNSGVFPHTLVVTDSAGEAVAATPLLQPGESIDLPIDLDPGTYSFTCRIVAQTPDGDLVDHFEEGMVTTVEVTG